MLPKYIFWGLLTAVCVMAWLRGRREERIAAAICAIGSLITVAIPYGHYDSVEYGEMVIDWAALGGFVALALWSDRFWPLWVAGFQLTSSIAHFLKAVDGDLVPRAYAAAERFWIYPIFLAIVIGALRAHHQSREGSELG